MAFSLTWMPAVLLEAGLKVAEIPGWQGRGRAEMGRVLGTLLHHTGGPATGNMPSLGTLIDGRSDLPGPLAQLGLGRDGTWYVIAAGRANHAGAGAWKGVTTGNTNFIGIECENSGRREDLPWPAVQMLALRQGVAALLRHAGREADWCAGHREYALPAGRKIDPLFDMAAFRRDVAETLAAGAPPLAPIPAAEPVAALPPGAVARPTLRRGNGGAWVQRLQDALAIVPADGEFGPQTEAAVRRFQRDRGLVPDGIVGPRTWGLLPRADLA